MKQPQMAQAVVCNRACVDVKCGHVYRHTAQYLHQWPSEWWCCVFESGRWMMGVAAS